MMGGIPTVSIPERKSFARLSGFFPAKAWATSAGQSDTSSPPALRPALLGEAVFLGETLLPSASARQQLLHQTLALLGESAQSEILTPDVLTQMSKVSRDNTASVALADQIQRLSTDLTRLNAREVKAFTEALAGSPGNNRLIRLVGDAVLHRKSNPFLLYSYVRELKLRHHALQKQQGRFGAGLDLFGITFAVGLATYVYGKVQDNKTALRLGKTLIIIGLVPNMLLTGIALSALIKLYFSGGLL